MLVNAHFYRYLRESFVPRLAPVSREMILNFIGQKVLGCKYHLSRVAAHILIASLILRSTQKLLRVTTAIVQG